MDTKEKWDTPAKCFFGFAFGVGVWFLTSFGIGLKEAFDRDASRYEDNQQRLDQPVARAELSYSFSDGSGITNSTATTTTIRGCFNKLFSDINGRRRGQGYVNCFNKNGQLVAAAELNNLSRFNCTYNLDLPPQRLINIPCFEAHYRR